MEKEKGFATVFSIFMSLLLFSFCGAFVIVASVLSVKNTANHAAEEAALVLASTLDCVKAQGITEANKAELVVCNLENDFVATIVDNNQIDDNGLIWFKIKNVPIRQFVILL